jgi:hypothetical protein
VGQHLVAVVELDPEHGVGQRFGDLALEHDRVFLGLRQCGTSGEESGVERGPVGERARAAPDRGGNGSA